MGGGGTVIENNYYGQNPQVQQGGQQVRALARASAVKYQDAGVAVHAVRAAWPVTCMFGQLPVHGRV